MSVVLTGALGLIAFAAVGMWILGNLEPSSDAAARTTVVPANATAFAESRGRC